MALWVRLLSVWVFGFEIGFCGFWCIARLPGILSVWIPNFVCFGFYASTCGTLGLPCVLRFPRLWFMLGFGFRIRCVDYFVVLGDSPRTCLLMFPVGLV